MKIVHVIINNNNQIKCLTSEKLNKGRKSLNFPICFTVSNNFTDNKSQHILTIEQF